MRRRHELTDDQWERIKDHLPGKASDPGRTAADHRLFVNAVIYQLKTGIAWPDLPARFGKPNSVWKRFDRWCAKGVWGRVAKALGDGERAEVIEELQLDSTGIKAHPSAATGRRRPGEKKATPTPADASAAPTAHHQMSKSPRQRASTVSRSSCDAHPRKSPRKSRPGACRCILAV